MFILDFVAIEGEAQGSINQDGGPAMIDMTLRRAVGHLPAALLYWPRHPPWPEKRRCRARDDRGGLRGGAEAPAATAALPAVPEAPAVTVAPKRERFGAYRIGDDPARAAAMRPLIARQAQAYGIPAPLAEAIVRIESRYNPNARNGPHMGLTQINHRTAAASATRARPRACSMPRPTCASA
jgi:hypothetical protein